MEKGIKTTWTDKIICPYCGYKDEESQEWFSGGEECTEVECASCGNLFDARLTIEWHYTSTKLEGENDD